MSQTGDRVVTHPVQRGVLPFPGWSEYEGPDSADLDGAQGAIASAAIPVPEGSPAK
jgi:hypothetical protein